MLSSSPSERTLLTYPNTGRTRLYIYVSLSILAYAYIRFAPDEWLNPKDQHPGPQGTMPFAWWLLIPICIMAFSAFLAIIEGLFLIGRKQNKATLEFDTNNFYINDSNGERTIPLKDIVSIKMVYGKSIFDAARSPFYSYAIGFGDPYTPETLTFTIFARNQPAFLNFRNLVKEKNPAVQQKDWSTNLNELGRWFKRRNS